MNVSNKKLAVIFSAIASTVICVAGVTTSFKSKKRLINDFNNSSVSAGVSVLNVSMVPPYAYDAEFIVSDGNGVYEVRGHVDTKRDSTTFSAPSFIGKK